MINTTVIGCGAAVEDLHVPWLLKYQRKGILAVTAVMDPNSARTAALSRLFPRARVCTRVEDAVAGADLALVASPAALHFEHSVFALRSGCHVLTEKPMATRTDHADELCRVAQSAGRILAVGLPRRYFPHVEEIARLVQRGELGAALTFEYREGAPYSWPVSSASAFKREFSGGGVLMDKGSHALDTLDQVFGSGTVISSYDDALADGVECNAVVEMSYPGPQARGIFQLSWDQPLHNGLRIGGERGEVWLGLDDIRGYRRRAVGQSWEYVRSSAKWPADLSPTPNKGQPAGYLECIEYEWIGAIRAILYGEEPPSTGKSAARVIRIIENAYRIAKPLDLAWLSEPEKASMRNRHWRKAL